MTSAITPLGIATAVMVAGALSACGRGSVPAATPRATTGTTATARSSATPTPQPDNLEVAIVGDGLGAYEITTVPVVVVRNLATTHDAVGVRVHFSVLSPQGANLAGADGDIAVIGLGETTAIAARAELRGVGDRVHEDITVTSWSAASSGQTLVGRDVAYECETSSCGGYGTVTGKLSSATTASTLTLTAVCYDAAGVIDGGNTSTTGGSPGDQQVAEPVIVTNRPARCELYATPGV